MLLPSHETVLNPKFGVVSSKTATCRSWTDKETDRLSRRVRVDNNETGEKCKFATKIASRFGQCDHDALWSDITTAVANLKN